MRIKLLTIGGILILFALYYARFTDQEHPKAVLISLSIQQTDLNLRKAIIRFRRDNQRYPNSLRELHPKYFEAKENPSWQDIETTFRYRKTEKTFILESDILTNSSE